MLVFNWLLQISSVCSHIYHVSSQSSYSFTQKLGDSCLKCTVQSHLNYNSQNCHWRMKKRLREVTLSVASLLTTWPNQLRLFYFLLTQMLSQIKLGNLQRHIITPGRASEASVTPLLYNPGDNFSTPSPIICVKEKASTRPIVQQVEKSSCLLC